MNTTMHATTQLPQAIHKEDVSLVRIYVLRATYLLIVIGLGAMIVPTVFTHPLISRGVIPSLLGGVWLLAWIGLRYPLQMLPLLMFEFAWKSMWMLAYGLPQWTSGQMPPTFSEDVFAIGLGVILMPLVIPWGYVYRHYIKQPGTSWRWSSQMLRRLWPTPSEKNVGRTTP